MTKVKILIATGGTGGHVFPAYSLANFLIKKEYKVSITTDQRGFEYLKNYKNLNLIKIYASPMLKKNIFIKIFSLSAIVYSIFRSIFFLLFNRPSIIFGMGGYSSFPICIAASILKIKFIIYENNLIIGKANKFLLPFAKKLFVSYKEIENIPKKYRSKVIEIGNIIREEIINANIKIKKFDQSEGLKILVLGGSQAAKVFGKELPEIFEKFSQKGLPIKIYQQCLKDQNEKLSSFYENKKIESEIFNFTNNIVKFYSKANLVITRSGASALGELINIKIPFISIPLPSSADNHQHKNAEFYEKKGYGFLLPEKDIKGKLYNIINSFLNDNSLLEKILLNQSQHSDKKIFENIIVQLENTINEKN